MARVFGTRGRDGEIRGERGALDDTLYTHPHGCRDFPTREATTTTTTVTMTTVPVPGFRSRLSVLSSSQLLYLPYPDPIATYTMQELMQRPTTKTNSAPGSHAHISVRRSTSPFFSSPLLSYRLLPHQDGSGEYHANSDGAAMTGPGNRRNASTHFGYKGSRGFEKESTTDLAWLTLIDILCQNGIFSSTFLRLRNGPHAVYTDIIP